MSRIEHLIKNAELIKKLINDNNIFLPKLKIKIIKPTTSEKSSSLVLFFLLDEENYSDTLYFINTDNGSLEGKVLGVYSNVGNKKGSFLLQLQLLLMFMSNVTLLHLDNYTNDPARAARGIYSDFNVRKRPPAKQWVGKDLAEQLLMSDGEMVYKPTGDSRKIVEKKIREIVAEQKEKSEIKGKALPFWNKFDNIDKFLRDLKQYSGGGGRVRKNKLHKYTRKNKNNLHKYTLKNKNKLR
jgi:hypothetical protein